MRTAHVSEEELEALLVGEANPGVLDHLDSCAACQEELKKWQAFLAAGSQWLPQAQTRHRVRQQAAMQAFHRRPLRWWVPLAAAAALVVALSLGIRSGDKTEANVELVLEEVDATLAADPLAAIAESEVVSVVVPETTPGEQSSS
ncbi:MAG: hypothetical protein ACOY7U_11040 [Acidobacteriota bacterium]|uniref:Zinc-finger domain-containing protein n=1 Tax=Thermoanaerobaculum aquaticum TaxID=1312852 RepID=A0A7C2NI10_9BACT